MFPEGDDLDAVFTMESGGREVAAEDPFHVLILGDWAGGRFTRQIEVDRDSFSEVIERLSPSVELDFEGAGDPLVIEFRDLEDFHPDGLFARLSIFHELREVRRQLSSADTFERAADTVRSWFEPAEISADSEAGEGAVADQADLLGSILDSADVPKARAGVEESELGRFISKIVAPHIVKVDEDEQKRLTAWLDGAAGDLMRKILHHPKFQEAEAAWRGLFFLVRRIETDHELRIFLLDCPKNELAAKLQAVNKLEESSIYRTLVEDGVNGRPFSVIGGNYGFHLHVEDVALLMRLATICDSAGSPFLSFVYPEMFGSGNVEDMVADGPVRIAEGSREAKLWDALRAADGSGALGLCAQRVIGRLPYGRLTEEAETFAFEEVAEGTPHWEYLWINPCFALTLLVAGSYRKYGADCWDRLANEIGKLPVHSFDADGESRSKPVAEVAFSESAAEVLVEAGLITLAAFRDEDRFRVIRWQSVAGRRLGQ